MLIDRKFLVLKATEYLKLDIMFLCHYCPRVSEYLLCTSKILVKSQVNWIEPCREGTCNTVERTEKISQSQVPYLKNRDTI